MKDRIKLAIIHFLAMIPAMFLVVQAHYVYDNYPSLTTSLLFPVNESIWEHTKLFVLPLLAVYLLVYAIIGRKYKKYIPATFLSLVYMPLLSCVSFGIYMAITPAHHPSSGVIFSSVILILGFIISYSMTVSDKQIPKKAKMTILVLTAAMIAAMAFFTYFPPKAEWLKWLFMDGVNMCYGIIQ